jgi:hypothetical protein
MKWRLVVGRDPSFSTTWETELLQGPMKRALPDVKRTGRDVGKDGWTCVGQTCLRYEKAPVLGQPSRGQVACFEYATEGQSGV